MQRMSLRLGIFVGLAAWACAGWAQVPSLINYQGRVTVDGTNFNGTGQFQFALVDGGTELSRQATATANLTGGFVTSVTVTVSIQTRSSYVTPALSPLRSFTSYW